MDPGVDSLTRSPSSANMPFFGILLCSVTLMQRCTLAVNSVSHSADIQCPNGCVCQLYHRINCANISLGDLPTQLPEVTTELQFTAGHLPIIPADSFLNLSHLMALHLSGNNIQQVKPGAFNGLSQLQYLHLNNNSIEALEIGVFREVTTVTYLHLENNLIANLIPGVFYSLERLNVLDLRNNRLTSLRDQTFKSVSALRHLFLSDNRIAAISPKAFRGSRELTQLYLEGNRLTAVPTDALRSLKRLRVLQLSNNVIPTLSSDTFGPRLRSLEEVYLDNTSLGDAASRAFSRLRGLKVLSMRGNRLVTLSFSNAFRSVKQFGLSGNAWRCDCGLTWLRDWLLKQNVTDQDEVRCTSPDAQSGKPLVNVQLEYLTCAPDNLKASARPSRTTKSYSPRPQSTVRPTPASTRGRLTPPRATTSENATPTNPDPCLSERITEVVVSEITASSLLVNWKVLEDLGDEYELWYSTGAERQGLRVIGGVQEMELSELNAGAVYKICVVPQSSLIDKCTRPSDNQCTVAQTLGLRGNKEPVQSESRKGQYALGTGIAVVMILLIVGALIVVLKFRSNRAGFQRHYDEDANTYVEHFETDQNKMGFDQMNGAYENIIDEGDV